MSPTQPITIESHQLGLKKPLIPQRQIDLPDDWFGRGGENVTLRQLLTRIVHEEVDAFHARQADLQLFRVLSAEQIEEGIAQGRIDPAAKENRQSVQADAAVRTALQAFEDGLYFVFIDDDQKESLDETVHLAANSTLKFIRLVALAGG
ncbi:MAG: hypothetical protein AAF633_23590 [Chloroflexota bacterium]